MMPRNLGAGHAVLSNQIRLLTKIKLSSVGGDVLAISSRNRRMSLRFVANSMASAPHIARVILYAFVCDSLACFSFDARAGRGIVSGTGLGPSTKRQEASKGAAWRNARRHPPGAAMTPMLRRLWPWPSDHAFAEGVSHRYASKFNYMLLYCTHRVHLYEMEIGQRASAPAWRTDKIIADELHYKPLTWLAAQDAENEITLAHVVSPLKRL